MPGLEAYTPSRIRRKTRVCRDEDPMLYEFVTTYRDAIIYEGEEAERRAMAFGVRART